MDSAPAQRAFATALGASSYPLLADFHPKGTVLQAYGAYNDERGTARRSVFIIDKEGIVRWKQLYEPGALPDTTVVLAELDKLRG